MSEHLTAEDREACADHQGTCPTPAELLRWQRDQALARAEQAEAEVERLRAAVKRIEALPLVVLGGHDYIDADNLDAALAEPEAER